MKINAIIQARMGSTRLPEKTMMKILDKPVLWHVVNRARKSRYIENIIVATTEKHTDDIICEFCRESGIDYFRGSENDVLDRYYQCAKEYGIDIIVRLTADDPLNDSFVIDKLIETFLELSPNIDYVGSDLNFKYPVGVGAQIFSFEALERVWNETHDDFEREHVMLYLLRNPEKFRISGIKTEFDYSNHRWTLDYIEDFRFIEAIYQHFQNGYFTMEELIDYLNNNPQIVQINSGHEYKFKNVSKNKV
ncbi:MAG: glycosyltransferase family protein [Candidatus Methanoperedens sp.]|nr:glycosyltransferase family protein [Candidatus Methanoperedens sp.]